MHSRRKCATNIIDEVHGIVFDASIVAVDTRDISFGRVAHNHSKDNCFRDWFVGYLCRGNQSYCMSVVSLRRRLCRDTDTRDALTEDQRNEEMYTKEKKWSNEWGSIKNRERKMFGMLSKWKYFGRVYSNFYFLWLFPLLPNHVKMTTCSTEL